MGGRNQNHESQEDMMMMMYSSERNRRASVGQEKNKRCCDYRLIIDLITETCSENPSSPQTCYYTLLCSFVLALTHTEKHIPALNNKHLTPHPSAHTPHSYTLIYTILQYQIYG